MCVLNSVMMKLSLSREAQAYIKKYHITYKKVLKEAKKKRDNDGYIEKATNKTKNMGVNKYASRKVLFFR